MSSDPRVPAQRPDYSELSMPPRRQKEEGPGRLPGTPTAGGREGPSAVFMGAFATRAPGLALNGGARRAPGSVQERLDSLGERVAGPVEAALHGTEIHAGYLSDLLVALSLELPETEDQAVMLRELLHGLLHDSP